MGVTFGARLRYLREAAGLTQIELAQVLHLATHTHISQMEGGIRQPSVRLLVRVANQFAVTLEYLLRDEVPISAVERYPDDHPPRDLAHLPARLHALREARHLSRAGLAAQSGIQTVSHINNVEAGRKQPSPAVLVRLADALGVTVDELLGAG